MADVIQPEPAPTLAPIKKHAIAPSKRKKRPRRRLGKPSKRDQALLEDVLRQRTSPITPREEKAVAMLFDRSMQTAKSMVETARRNFAEKAERYVAIHGEAAEGALADRDFETAGTLAWQAMKELSSEGVRIIDRADSAVQVPRVMIGIKLGGLSEDTRPNAPTITVATQDIVEQP